ncbi:hypothetical protein [Cytobacillus stercorigallinarum]|uniref:hypothetical protein n=1 Tax=Cytobacillus stercorigallinarum TaxID=2762240 RepID=UPI001CD8CC0B|nr:hypothetical protein [Cytobacillus stercorigallinarum]
MFASFNAELPAITIFIVCLTMNWYMILLFLFMLVLAILLFRDNKLIKDCTDWLLLRTPFIVSKLIINRVAVCERSVSFLFCRILSTI